MKKYKILIYFAFFVFFSVKGQINTYSPYSYFGIGNLYNMGTTANIAMGGLGVSITNTNLLNHINPASYSFLKRTSFEFGATSSFTKMSQNDLSQRNFTSNLFNIGLGFPISNKIGVSVSVLPYSSVGYNVTTQLLADENIGLTNYTYSGSGGLNMLLLGGSWKIIENLSIGTNINYFFGAIERTATVETDSAAINFRENISAIIRDFNFDFGLLYVQKIGNYNINFGATISPEREIESKIDTFQHTYISSGDYESFMDTILSVTGSQDYITIPLTYSTGLSIESDKKWLIGLDYKHTNWENYSMSDSLFSYMRNKNEIIFGGSFIPNKGDIHNYFNRIEYRIGVSHASGYLDLAEATDLSQIPENLLKDISFSFGMGLPMNKVFSMANIALKYGHRGSSDNNFIKEQYFSIYLSMTLNEKWFNKRKIE